ncbi:MAG: response regulator transcription factor [Burkholderiales bacterium]
MKLLLVDDHSLFRSGLRLLLSDLDDSVSFDEAGSVEELPVDLAAPDLVLLDLNLRGVSGRPALERLRERLPDAPIVALSGEEDPELIRCVIEDGASGFIPKASTPAVMIGALRLVLAGGIYLPPAVLRAAPSMPPAVPPASHPADRAEPGPSAHPTGTRPPMPFVAGLTGRQQDVLMLAVRGKSNKQIAREFDLSEGTVKQHLSAAFRVLGVSNRTEAVYAVAELGTGGWPRHGD